MNTMDTLFIAVNDTVSITTNDVVSINELVKNTSTLVEKADTLIKNSDTSVIDLTWAGLVNAVTILGSIVTISGLIMIMIELHKRKVTKSCQAKVILDLIRHFLINNVIMQALYLKIEGKMDKLKPLDGLFDRFAILESDLDFSQFRINDKIYERIHQCSLYLRNYNIAVRNAEKIFKDSNYPEEVKKDILNDIFQRSITLTKDLLKISNARDLKVEKKVKKYLADRNTHEIEKFKNKNIIKLDIEDVPIGNRFYDTYVDWSMYKKLIEIKYTDMKVIAIDHKSSKKESL